MVGGPGGETVTAAEAAGGSSAGQKFTERGRDYHEYQVSLELAEHPTLKAGFCCSRKTGGVPASWCSAVK